MHKQYRVKNTITLTRIAPSDDDALRIVSFLNAKGYSAAPGIRGKEPCIDVAFVGRSSKIRAEHLRTIKVFGYGLNEMIPQEYNNFQTK
jgi:hypothetical protein